MLPSTSSRPSRWPFARWPRTTDALLAGLTFAASVLLENNGPDGYAVRALGDVPLPAFAVFGFASGALLWRRTRPLVVLTACMAAYVTSLAFGFGDLGAQGIALYSAGRYATSANIRPSAYLMAASTVLGAVDATIAGGLTDAPFAVLLTFLIWYAGVRIRNRGERAALLEREQAARGRQVLAEERARIARELHDVVAHRVSLMTVQAGAAKTVAADDPEAAVKAMAAVEEAGREALGELRHLLGVLRLDAEPDGLGPQPSVADIPRLVEEFRNAGLDVTLTMDGVDGDLSSRVNLSAYRIVQEALTNVLKHAGPGTRAQVRLAADRQHLAVHVLDDGDGSSVLPGSGHGIVGMRERALLLGGRLEANPRPGGGFQVDAHLPIGEETT